MNRDQLAFLVGGLAFGILIGFGSYHAVHKTPDLEQTAMDSQIASPAGPPAPTQMGGPNAGGGAPMVARINELKRMLQNDPQNDQILLALANIYYDAAMWREAAGYYERVAEMKPDPDVLTDLGVCYRGLREFDKAIATFERAIEQDGGHWQSLFNKAIVSGLDLGQFDAAREAIDSIEAIEPQPEGLDPGRLVQLREMLDRVAAEGERRVVIIRALFRLALLAALAALGWWISRLFRGARPGVPRPKPERPLSDGPMVRDRVCNTFLLRSRAIEARIGDETHYFCSDRCRTHFVEGSRTVQSA